MDGCTALPVSLYQILGAALRIIGVSVQCQGKQKVKDLWIKKEQA